MIFLPNSNLSYNSCRLIFTSFFLLSACAIAFAQSNNQLLNVHHSNLLNTSSPYEGSLGYDQNQLYFFSGTFWKSFEDHWRLNGNNNITASNFVGCTNNQNLNIRTNNNGRLMITSTGNVGININNPTAKFQVDGANNNDLFVSINGNVGIGTSSPSQRLHVNGNVVANAFNTPDYVFENYFKGSSYLPSYSYYSLDEVFDFVKKNKHLPNVPSANEVEKQGGMIVNRATEKI